MKKEFPLLDLCLFFFLLLLFFYGAKRTQHFVGLQSKSMIHELDQSFADQLYTAQRQARITEQLCASRYQDAPEDWKQKIEKVHSGLSAVENKYGNNSPGVMFLGPIGTAAIVLKENELKQKLMEYLDLLGTILHVLVRFSYVYTPSATVQESLAKNQNYIGLLLKRKAE